MRKRGQNALVSQMSCLPFLPLKMAAFNTPFIPEQTLFCCIQDHFWHILLR